MHFSFKKTLPDLTVKMFEQQSQYSFIAYKKNGKYHKLNGPAYIDNQGMSVWIQNGNYHRLDGPAYVKDFGNTTIYGWYFNHKGYNSVTMKKPVSQKEIDRHTKEFRKLLKKEGLI